MADARPDTEARTAPSGKVVGSASASAVAPGKLTTAHHIRAEGSAVKNVDAPANQGKPVSGRTWKKLQIRRSSAAGRSRTGNQGGSAFRVQLGRKRIRAEAKALADTMREEAAERRTLQAQRREEKRKRKIANEMKSSQVQEIVHTDKIKRMNKKQLRKVRKTRVNDDGEVEFATLWDK